MTALDLDKDDEGIIIRISGRGKIKHRLVTLGFFKGNSICMLHKSLGNALLQVGTSRIAVSTKLLNRIELERIG
jgi:Fe2+ transport system protein FeoA